MKNLTSIIIFHLLLTASLFAQDCTQCIFLQSNKVITETAYLGTDLSYTVVISVPSNSGAAYANVKGISKVVTMETFGVNGKSLGKRNFIYQCLNNIFLFDIHSEPNQVDATGLNSKVGPSFMGYPPGMKVGQRFPDTDLQYQVMMYGASINWTDKITNRQVVARETVTTPAGSWTALKITYNLTTVLKGAKPRNPPVYYITEWYVPGFGIVQYEGYGRKLEITKITG
jgi:hypothetical protein